MSVQTAPYGGAGYGEGGAASGQVPPGHAGGVSAPPGPGPTRDKPGDLFTSLGGIPANISVVIGLFMVLLAAMLPDCRIAAAQATIARYEEAQRLALADLDEFRDAQDRERAAERANPMVAVDPGAEPRRLAAYQQRIDQVRTQRNLGRRHREAIEAVGSVQGMRAHLAVNWIGRVLLILGLLMMTARAEGVKQKVYVLVLLVAMFSSLTGVRLDFGAEGRLGGGERASTPELRVPAEVDLGGPELSRPGLSSPDLLLPPTGLGGLGSP